ncbi:hypothetical protein [Chryseobacterium oryctis]|uniref:Uncharacterized protein n=1 Tax=Chryseobacterium oryctis TaxID=2952618 RepID=A0ABT3HRS8_9FLAO|nr:hypothetical protein [Chryseobacterium oryctis]MCW3162485.1 hypothetical protein [Chryseobacterium oryctis]
MAQFSKYLLFFFLGISLQSCSQKKENIIQNANVTSKNIVEEIAKEVKYYPVEENYGIRYGNRLPLLSSSQKVFFQK